MNEEIARQIRNLRRDIAELEKRRDIIIGDISYRKYQLAKLEKHVEKTVKN